MLEYITQGIGRGGFEEGRLPVLLHIECVQLHETRQAEHFHADHAELILIQKGSCQVRVAGGQEAVQAGDFVLCSAGEPHACWTQDGEQATVISCGFTRLLCRGREENCFLEQRERPIVHAGEGSQALEQILLSLMQAAQDAHEQSQEICSYLSAAAILLALRLQRAAEEQIEQARYSLGIRTQLYLDRHYTEPLTLDGIAQAMGVSKYHLDRVFLAGAGAARLDRSIHTAHCPAVRVQQLHLFYFRVPKARRPIAGRLSEDNSGHCRNAQDLMISIEHLGDMLMGCGKTAEGYCKPAGKSV